MTPELAEEEQGLMIEEGRREQTGNAKARHWGKPVVMALGVAALVSTAVALHGRRAEGHLAALDAAGLTQFHEEHAREHEHEPEQGKEEDDADEKDDEEGGADEKAEDGGCATPKSMGLPWKKLSDDQQKSAKVLGWEEKDWDCDGSDCEVPVAEFKDWSSFEGEQKDAAKELGWDMEAWDCNLLMRCALPATENKSWKEFTEAEENSIKALGWDKESWDCDPEDDVGAAEEEEDKKEGDEKDDKEDNDKDDEDKDNEDKEDKAKKAKGKGKGKGKSKAKGKGKGKGKCSEPKSTKKIWEDLSDEELEGAKALGWNHQSWDCELERRSWRK